MLISNLDHLVITVRDLEATSSFYQTILGLDLIIFEDGRRALKVENQKINLHLKGEEIAPHAAFPTPGSADLCFITPLSITTFREHLTAHKITVELGPVERSGALGPMDSLYFRDPDQNLIEVSHYKKPAAG